MKTALKLLVIFNVAVATQTLAANQVAVAQPNAPIWLVQQTNPAVPAFSARTYGESEYGAYKVHASLEVSCSKDSPQHIAVALQVAPQSLGFASDPFEGPDATASGPMRLQLGNRPPLSAKVWGAFTDGGPFQVGMVFQFGTTFSSSQMAYWPTAAGQKLEVSVAPEKPGQPALLAHFVLPSDPTGLAQVLAPCLPMP